jgi:hypothetical protein
VPAEQSIFVMSMMLDVKLARFRRMMMRVRAVARGRVRVMRRDLVVVSFIMLRGFAMMARGFLVMIRGVMMMLAGRMFVRHVRLLFGGTRRWGATPSQEIRFAK